GGHACFGYVGQDVTEARAAEQARLAAETSLQMGLAGGEAVTWELNLATGEIVRADSDAITPIVPI
ncbi:MAG: hypothetical protein KGO51_12055, partial [Alphaproteobacteria bacterium]|nr:hypothetical protein [Alphaproteobacteria bacterium]